jgi:cardiolipin synthase
MSPLKAPQLPVANSTAGAPGPTGETDNWRTIPNLISALRMLLIVPFCYAAIHGQDGRAVIIFFIAGVSDSFDGYLARKLNQSSKLGRLVDPVADKILAGIAYVVLSLYRDGFSAIPHWAMGAVLARDVLILVGCVIVYRLAHTTAFKPSLIGKVNTFFELLLIGWFLTASVYPVVSPGLPVLYVLIVVTIAVSFAGYARQGVRMIRAARG